MNEWQIYLTDPELSFAAWGGAQRQLEAEIKGRRQQFPPADPYFNHELACMGELAVAKATDCYWFPVYPDPKAIKYDVGTWQVRTVSKRGHSLIVRESDEGKLEQRFVSVWADLPNRCFTLRGYEHGHKVRELGTEEPAAAGKPRAWFLKPNLLQPMQGSPVSRPGR